MFNETEEKACVVNSGEPQDVYDHVERLQREIKQLTAERDEFKGQNEFHQSLYIRTSTSRDFWKKAWREQISTIRAQSQTIREYQHSDINLRFEVERLREHIERLEKRSLWQRIRNTNPTY